jgi:hypothetical protein
MLNLLPNQDGGVRLLRLQVGLLLELGSSLGVPLQRQVVEDQSIDVAGQMSA